MSNDTPEPTTTHEECGGPCGEVFNTEDLHYIANVGFCDDCYYEHPDVVRELYEDLKADMLSDDY